MCPERCCSASSGSRQEQGNQGMTDIPDPHTIPNPDALKRVQAKKSRKAAKKPADSEAASNEPGIDALLARCAINLTEQANRGILKRAYGRDDAIEAIWQLLRADSNKRPLILGKARSGKTSLAYEIARRIALGNCPDELKGIIVYETAPASLISALQFGEGWRENLNKLLQGLGETSGALLFLRDAHSATGFGKQGDSESDLADALVSALRAGKLRWLAEARADLWRTVNGAETSFAECFTPVILNEMTTDATRVILELVALDRAGDPAIEPQIAAIESILDIAGRFLLNQALPGKAIDLLDEALRYARRASAPTLEPEHVIASFAERTGLARLLLDDASPFEESAVHRYFADRVLGQEPAVAAVVQAVALLKARLNDPARPMGVFLFLGPTGVGKTELAKTLCAFLFGAEERLLRFNMADFAFYWQYEELFGDPDAEDLANRRGMLSRKLTGETFGVVLLDEFEKAHETIFQRFLQVFDEGILVNPAGEEINLRNMVLIMTSNFGAQFLQGESWGFAAREDLDAAERRIMRETESFFTPEFINRLDSVIFFKPLSLADMRQIAYRELQRLFEREGLVRRRIAVELDDAVVDLLLKHGYSLRFGARYLKRQIEKRISYPLARAILAGTPPNHSTVPTLLRLYTRGEHIEAGWVREDDEPATGEHEAAPEIAALLAALPVLEERLASLSSQNRLPELHERMDDLLAKMSGPAFWDNGRAAETHLVELGEISRRVDSYETLERQIDDLRTLVERIEGRFEGRLLPEASRLSQQIERALTFIELEAIFSTPEEWNDALIVVQTAPGEPREHHWADQLVGTYIAWAERRDLTCAVIDESLLENGEWRTTLVIEGRGAYGLLQSERGTHRFSEIVRTGDVRRKQISQVLVNILPVIEEPQVRLSAGELMIELRPIRERGRRLHKLRHEARAVYLPTGNTVLITCEGDAATTEARARMILRGLLHVERSTPSSALQADPPWGSVVRAYQLSQRSSVKDPRTGIAHPHPRAVFDGDIDRFVIGYLRKMIRE